MDAHKTQCSVMVSKHRIYSDSSGDLVFIRYPDSIGLFDKPIMIK